jgi:hypothetical protein
VQNHQNQIGYQHQVMLHAAAGGDHARGEKWAGLRRDPSGKWMVLDVVLHHWRTQTCHHHYACALDNCCRSARYHRHQRQKSVTAGSGAHCHMTA